MPDEQALSRLHYEIIQGLLARGACPTNAELAHSLGGAPVESSLVALAEIHGVVLHPHVCEPWVVHPFSLTPTIHWIEAPHRGWWAPCIWCAFGVAALAGGKVTIHTRRGGEVEPLAIPVMNGVPKGFDDWWVHFAIPPARAWQNVHLHCSMVLAFSSPGEIDLWCAQHGLPKGEAAPVPQVARLARHWYGAHANKDWRKWSVAEAQDIFTECGFTAPFWDLGAKKGKF